MSSTNRGGKRSPADNYETPGWTTRRLLEDPTVELPGGVWCDPCAGGGKIIRATNAYRSDITQWYACELRDECREPLVKTGALTVIADFVQFPESIPDVDVIITNPPYRLAYEFIEICIQKAQVTAMLLRLNFLGSEKRASFMRSFAPDVYLMPNRPSFTTNKKGKPSTDSIEYAWFVWRGPNPRREGRLRVLASTALADRVD
jgi:hypothetical protein